MVSGIADTNLCDGIEFGKINLWSWDYYHARTHGYYLHAPMVFSNLSGVDPRSLGKMNVQGLNLACHDTK